MKKLIAIILFTAAIAPCLAQKVKPSLKLTKGSTYYMVSNVLSTVTQTVNGQAMKIDIQMEGKNAFEVVDIKDTVYTLEVTYKRIAMKMNMPQGAVEMNSDKKDATDAPSKVILGLVDKPFTVLLSTRGRVLAVKNVEEIVTSTIKSTVTDEAQQKQLSSQLLQSFGEKAFKSNLEQSLFIYPAVKVAKNDKWTIDTHLQSTLEADINSTYQLTDVTDGYYVIHGDSKIATDKNKQGAVNGLPVKYNLTGTLVSDIKADKTTGWVVEAKLKQDISGDFNILDCPQVPGGMTVPMAVHSDATTTDK